MVDSTGTTSYSYDDIYRLTSVTFPGSRTVSYGYDDAGRRTSMTYPGGTNQVAYGYDNANHLTSVTDWNSNAISYAYDDAGRLATKTLPSGTGIVSSYTYDTPDRLTGIGHVKGGTTTIASVSYTLDDVGNRTQRVDQQGTHTYAYDDVYRLTSVAYPGPSTTSHTFDAFGNRLTKTNGSGTTDYTYDDADRLTSVDPPAASATSYTWDDNGSLTARGSDAFAWDYEERMTSATVNSVTTTFAYRGDGLRNSRTTGGNTTTFTWDVAAGLPVVIDDGNQYVYGAGLEAMKQSGSWYYYLADGLGSTMAIVDSSGAVQKSYTYDVYGKPNATGSLANEFDFAGQQTDPTSLQYLRARYMDPETGVFVSREPLAASPNWIGNVLRYAESSPTRYIDPSGLMLVDGTDGGAAYQVQPPPREDPDGSGPEIGVNPRPGVFWEDFVRPDGKWSIHLCYYLQTGTESGWAKDCGESNLAVTVGEYDVCSAHVGTNEEGYGYQAISCLNTKSHHIHSDIEITSTPGSLLGACVRGAVITVTVSGVATGVAVLTGFIAAPGAGAIAIGAVGSASSGCVGGIIDAVLS